MKLEHDVILYADMLNSLRLGGDVLYEDTHALLLRDMHSSILYAAAENPESAEQMAAYLPRDFEILVSHDCFCNEALHHQYQMNYENCCYHCAYLDTTPLPISLKPGYEIRSVTRAYMKDVIRLYQKEMPTLANEEYLGLCMDAGMYGVFDGNELCGFISVHEGGYGSIGMLEIDERYRRNGFGVALERHMINIQLSRGRIPYGEIFSENVASIALQKKVGMSIHHAMTYWFYQ